MIEEKCPDCGILLKKVKDGNPLHSHNLYRCPGCKIKYRIPYKGKLIKVGGP
jgi:uncharacterized protein with PIN domain